MSVLKNHYENFKEIISSVPGPSPWYSRPNNSKLVSGKYGLLKWKEAGEKRPLGGKTLLITPNGDTLMIFDYYCYVLVLRNSMFLFWYSWDKQRKTMLTSVNSIHFIIFDAENLQPLKKVTNLCEEMDRNNQVLLYSGREVDSFEIPKHLEPFAVHSIEVPNELKTVEEVLILAESTAVKDSKVSLALYILKPKENTVTVIPQDWFNKGDFDFGYEWPTRVARDPITHKIFGEGIRIGNFVLDESGQVFEGWLSDRFGRPSQENMGGIPVI